VYSPRLAAALALGFVKRNFAAAGTELMVEGRRAAVVELPLK
jgi:hypothetical protein